MINWSPSPILVSIGPLTIRWYGLMFLLGFTIGYLLIKRMCEREGKSFERLEGLLIYVILGTTIGARLGHCLFYEPAYYLANPLAILKIWEGGLASHGGGLGVLFATWLFVRRNSEFSWLWVVDRLSIPLPMIGAFIRIGNFMNSEILGRPSEVPWAVIFSRVDKLPRHPAQLYESISYFILFIINLLYYRKNPNPPRGLIFGFMLVWIFCWRIVWEFFKENQEAFEQGMVLNMGQLLSLPFVAVGSYLVWRAYKAPAAQAPAMPTGSGRSGARSAKRKRR